jgi:hypothetical protein
MAHWLFLITEFVAKGNGWKKQVEWGVAAAGQLQERRSSQDAGRPARCREIL